MESPGFENERVAGDLMDEIIIDGVVSREGFDTR